jgi:fatty-acyl-CoA synthase
MYSCWSNYGAQVELTYLSPPPRPRLTLIFRKKFSVRSFTPDCLKYQCSAMQYIGELCRYLVNAPPCEDDHKLQLKYAIGNGMRPDIWVAFQKRYNVKNIVEFYGATEGNVGCFNNIGKVGAIGYMPLFLQKFKSIKYALLLSLFPSLPPSHFL